MGRSGGGRGRHASWCGRRGVGEATRWCGRMAQAPPCARDAGYAAGADVGFAVGRVAGLWAGTPLARSYPKVLSQAMARPYAKAPCSSHTRMDGGYMGWMRVHLARTRGNRSWLHGDARRWMDPNGLDWRGRENFLSALSLAKLKCPPLGCNL